MRCWESWTEKAPSQSVRQNRKKASSARWGRPPTTRRTQWAKCSTTFWLPLLILKPISSGQRPRRRHAHRPEPGHLCWPQLYRHPVGTRPRPALAGSYRWIFAGLLTMPVRQTRRAQRISRQPAFWCGSRCSYYTPSLQTGYHWILRAARRIP